VRRREFISLLGGTAMSWPLAARAQQPAMPIIGFLNGAAPEGYALYATAFRQGLKEAGYVDGQNLTIEYRWAEGQYERLPAQAGHNGGSLQEAGLNLVAKIDTFDSLRRFAKGLNVEEIADSDVGSQLFKLIGPFVLAVNKGSDCDSLLQKPSGQSIAGRSHPAAGRAGY
jgi:hypothetical protein